MQESSLMSPLFLPPGVFQRTAVPLRKTNKLGGRTDRLDGSQISRKQFLDLQTISKMPDSLTGERMQRVCETELEELRDGRS